jgi:hypothetical protein
MLAVKSNAAFRSLFTLTMGAKSDGNVTGITDGLTIHEKIAEYTWVYIFPGASPELQDFLNSQTAPGKALFRLYDDGWRFVQFQ